jgi:peptidase M1-like protein
MRLISAIGFLLCVPLVPARAVQFAPPGGKDTVTEVSYEQRFAELKELRPVPNGVASVSGLVLKRDAGEFTFGNGKFYLLTPVGGRTVGAVFLGQGRVTFTPPSRIEQERLARFQKSKTLDAPFSSLVLLFADSTIEELEAKLTFGPGQAPSEVRDRFRSSLDILIDEDSKSLDPDLMSALLNGESNGVFYAHIGRLGGSPLMFMVNPSEVEGVSLSHRVRRYGWTRQSEVITRFPLGGERPAEISGERVRQAEIRNYVIETTLTNSGSGDLSFAAAARVEITAERPLGPWVAFGLYEKLRVDSARWETGRPATVFKGNDASLLWIKLESKLAPGETRPLKLYYHGDLIDRFIDFFFIKSSADWYPRSLEGRSLATFDLTFRSPKDKLLASVGDQVESSTAGQVTTSRWVSSTPIRNASFNLGIFKDYQIQEEGIPPVTVLLAEGMHRKIGGLRQKNMKETVGGDVARSLRFFQHVYGEVPAKRFYATEIPTFHGEAFPGMVNLSWWTFHQTDQAGEDEVFRAHEVAHQWWGIGVDFKSYHDQWLSEGMADFSGLWYLQTVRKDTKKYFDVLHRWRYRIMEHEDDPGPIWLGYRTTSSKDSTGYDVAVYKKGAWVMHMLRIMMLDLKTMSEDRFTETMRDFYRTYQGKRASTEDFRRVAEAHLGMDLGWFFDQWIYRSEIPTYRVAYKTEPAEGGQFRVKLQVRQENVSDDFQMYVPVMLDLGNDRIARVRAKVKGPRSEIDLPLMPAAPKSIRFNDLDGVLAQVSMEGWSK